MAQSPLYTFKTHKYNLYIVNRTLNNGFYQSSKINRRWSYQPAHHTFEEMLLPEHVSYLEEVHRVRCRGSHCSDFPPAKQEPSQMLGCLDPAVLSLPSDSPHSLHFGKGAVPALWLPFQILREQLNQGGDIQGKSKEDISFACCSPKCVNTWSDQQRGVLPG